MRKLAIVAAAVAAIAISTLPVAAQSFFLHNGGLRCEYMPAGTCSLMSMEYDGAIYTIKYVQPRAGLFNIGIRNGTILFQGSVRERLLDGTAYRFKSGCAPLPYNVAGGLGGDDIVLEGAAAQYSRYGCHNVGFAWDEQSLLRFTWRYGVRPSAGY